MSESPSPAAQDRPARRRPSARAPWLLAAALLGMAALAVAFVEFSASPFVCGSCHEMEPKVEAWKTSAHTKVGCPECHEPSRPWYALPVTVAERASLLARDVAIHLSPAEETSAAPHRNVSAAIPDATCLGCHSAARQISVSGDTLIDHEEHADRNGSCVSCHLWTAHPPPQAERGLLLMSQCFACHGRSAGAKAPGTCDACHPDSFELEPASHEPPDWRDAHGEPALTSLDECLMCHDRQVCQDCHGVDMPHPPRWAERASLHGAASHAEPDTCGRCHSDAPEFCASCHHEDYDSARGPWVDQHPDVVEERGAAFCFDCHEATLCVRCHTTPPTGTTG